VKITEKWLKEKDACGSGIVWFNEQKETDGLKVVKKLVKRDSLSWANWLIVRLMPYKMYVSYAVYAAEQVLPIYEKKRPGDGRPRKAIEAAKKCIKNPSKENKAAAAAAAAAALQFCRLRQRRFPCRSSSTPSLETHSPECVVSR